MTKTIKRIACLIMCALIALSFSGCSNTEMTEENVKSTVETVETALKEFDSKTLEKYVESETLSYIMKFANKHEQFKKLGQAIFENLTMEVKDVDLEKKTVSVSVKNKDLYTTASNFVYDLLQNYSSVQLLQKLDDEKFLDNSLGELTKNISQAKIKNDELKITLTIKQGKKNLVLGFNETAEDAVSGGAIEAIKSII